MYTNPVTDDQYWSAVLLLLFIFHKISVRAKVLEILKFVFLIARKYCIG